MIAAMDWLTIIPLIVGVISNLSTFASVALAGRLLTILMAVCIIGSVSVLAIMVFAWLSIMVFAWLSIKRAIDEHHASPAGEPLFPFIKLPSAFYRQFRAAHAETNDDRKPTGARVRIELPR